MTRCAKWQQEPVLHLLKADAVLTASRATPPCVGNQIRELIKQHIDYRGRLNVFCVWLEGGPPSGHISSGNRKVLHAR